MDDIGIWIKQHMLLALLSAPMWHRLDSWIGSAGESHETYGRKHTFTSVTYFSSALIRAYFNVQDSRTPPLSHELHPLSPAFDEHLRIKEKHADRVSR